jgi:sugar lactone lactonase YvrE
MPAPWWLRWLTAESEQNLPASRRRSCRRYPRRPSCRAGVEVLECRLAPAVFSVLNTADAGAGSLRQAILDAEQAPGQATIVFAPGVSGTIDLTSPLPDLTGTIDIEGPARDGITVQRSQAPGTPAFRIFTVTASATVTLARLTVTDGSGSFPGDIFVGDRSNSGTAGIIRVDPITGAQSLVTANATTQSEQLLSIALEQAGTLVATESGALPGGVVRIDPTTGTVTEVSVNGNFSTPDSIAVNAAGVLFVADASAGVIRVDPTTGAQTVLSPTGPSFNAGGIALDAAGTIFVVNGSSFAVGVIRLDPSTGARTPVSMDGNFVIPEGTAIAPNGDIFVSDESAFGGTGGIIRVDPATGAQTRVASGGLLLHPTGIALDTSGNLLVADADALGGLGAVIRVDPATGAQAVVASGGRLSRAGSITVSQARGDGGGIFNAGTLVLRDMTIAHNSAGRGGGIDNLGTLTLENSTVANNSAGDQGGGIFNAGTLTVSDSTIAGNAAGGGGGIASSRSAAVHGTIIARNHAPAGADASGSFISRGHNLIGDATGASGFTAAGDLAGTTAAPVDPRLGPLQANGGPTATLALLTGSPAIDAGDPAAFPATDQRGFPRPADGSGHGVALPDIGAFEVSTRPPAGNAAFVSQLYRDLLGREPDAGGLAYWTGLLDSGQATTYQVAWAIESSSEYHLREVRDIYRRLLRREADPIGLAGWTQYLDQGGTAESLQALILGSGEYFTRIAGGTIDGFLEALYGDVLHRAADAVGLQGWGELMEDEGATPTDIAAAVMNSLESDIAEVQGLYELFLHRPADSLGLLAFTSALQHGLTNEVAAMVMLGSAEYFQNAS